MTQTNNWPDKPGVPPDADNEGYHWIKDRSGDLVVVKWSGGHWWHGSVCCGSFIYEDSTYLGPAIPPTAPRPDVPQGELWRQSKTFANLRPQPGDGWLPLQDLPRAKGDDEEDVILLTTTGIVTARWSPGRWIDCLETREYDGPVLVCYDDALQIEVEEIGNEISASGVLGWLPRSALPAPPTQTGGEEG